VRRYALAILTTVYISNYVDRQILSILLQDIKVAFDVSDTALGFLAGIAFAFFYATLGIPIALFADRGNRRNVIAASLGLFSVFTVLCGSAQSFLQLALARVGVGVGEAGTSPPSHSMIADLYPPQERATAMAIFALGVNIGILIGFLVGGWINQLYGWRVAFMTVGVPGLVLALLVRLTLPEPERGSSEGRVAEADAAAPPVGATFRLFWERRSLRHISFAAGLNAFVGYGAVAWLPTYLARSHGMSSGDIGTALALIIGVAGGLGTYFGGLFADRLARLDVRWNLWLVAAAVVGGIPFAVGVFLSGTPAAALSWFVVPAMVGAIYLGPCLAMVQGLVSLRARTAASAIFLFILNIIGFGMGPQAIGILSDLLEPRFGNESLRYALLASGVIGLWSGLHFFVGARTLREDLAAATAEA